MPREFYLTDFAQIGLKICRMTSSTWLNNKNKTNLLRKITLGPPPLNLLLHSQFWSKSPRMSFKGIFKALWRNFQKINFQLFTMNGESPDNFVFDFFLNTIKYTKPQYFSNFFFYLLEKLEPNLSFPIDFRVFPFFNVFGVV